MKANLKPATAKARVLLKKLQALAERGIDGEKAAAQKKLARLKARLDFTAPDPAETPDLFLGTFKRSTKARWIHSFDRHDFDVANSVKWAIESAGRRKRPATLGAGLHVHPYTVALSLGKQIRFSAPLEQIAAELHEVTQKRLSQKPTEA